MHYSFIEHSNNTGFNSSLDQRPSNKGPFLFGFLLTCRPGVGEGRPRGRRNESWKGIGHGGVFRRVMTDGASRKCTCENVNELKIKKKQRDNGAAVAAPAAKEKKTTGAGGLLVTIIGRGICSQSLVNSFGNIRRGTLLQMPRGGGRPGVVQLCCLRGVPAECNPISTATLPLVAR